MRPKTYLRTFITKLSETIERSENQWKDNRFASVNSSESEPDEDDDFGQYQHFMQKYRGKNGDIKPLGLLIYRRFIFSLIILCLVLTAVSLPAAMVYSTGGGISQFQKSASFSKTLLLFSIANLPYYRFDDLAEEDLHSISLHRDLAIFTDILAIILVILFLLYWRVISIKMINNYVAKSPSPHLYCLKIENIKGCTEEQLRNHFRKFGRLSQISCVYDHQNLLTDLTKLVKLVTKYRHFQSPPSFVKNKTSKNQFVDKEQSIQNTALHKEPATHDDLDADNAEHKIQQQSAKQNSKSLKKHEQLLSKIEESYKEIAITYLKRSNKPGIKECFLCFEDIRTRNKVADLYRYSIMPQKLSFDSSATQELLHDQILQENLDPSINMISNTSKITPKVQKCRYEPLTLNWQNFDIDKSSQILKIACQTGLLILMLFMILLALFLLNVNSSHVKQQLLTNTTLPANTTINDTSGLSKQEDETKLSYEQLLNSQETSPQIIYTFCASLTYSTFKWQYYSLCSEYFSIERNRFVLMLSFSLLVAVINLLTNRILWALVAFRQYRTLAQRNRFLIRSIFMFSLINSAVLILFVRQEYTGPILRKIVSFIFGFTDDAMKVTVYPEFNRQWYMNIGNQLMMNYVVSLLVFPHFHIVLHWIRKKIRQYQSSKKNKAVPDPNFNYCTFYALSLKALFFAMLYSTCMPIFYLLCFISLNVQLYVGKLLIRLKFVKEPVFVDNNAIEVAVDMVPYSLILHCILNIFFLSVDEIFPTEDSYFYVHTKFFEHNFRRMQRCYIYLLLITLLSLFIWNRSRVYKILIKYWLGKDSSAIQCDFKMKFTELKGNPAFLSSYKMRDNPKYKILNRALRLFEAHLNPLYDQRRLKPNHPGTNSEIDLESLEKIINSQHNQIDQLQTHRSECYTEATNINCGRLEESRPDRNQEEEPEESLEDPDHSEYENDVGTHDQLSPKLQKLSLSRHHSRKMSEGYDHKEGNSSPSCDTFGKKIESSLESSTQVRHHPPVTDSQSSETKTEEQNLQSYDAPLHSAENFIEKLQRDRI